MMLKIAFLSITGNRAAETGGADGAQETVVPNGHFCIFPTPVAFLNLTGFAASDSAGCRIIWARVRAWQFGFATSNPPLNRSAQQRNLPTGKGHQRARLALR